MDFKAIITVEFDVGMEDLHQNIFSCNESGKSAYFKLL